MNFLRYALYFIYNLCFAIISIYTILFLETYVNGLFIPDKFVWDKEGTRRDPPHFSAMIIDRLLLCLEGALLLVLLYLINKWFLKTIIKPGNFEIILRYTMVIISICIITFICSLIFEFYFPLL